MNFVKDVLFIMGFFGVIISGISTIILVVKDKDIFKITGIGLFVGFAIMIVMAGGPKEVMSAYADIRNPEVKEEVGFTENSDEMNDYEDSDIIGIVDEDEMLENDVILDEEELPAGKPEIVEQHFKEEPGVDVDENQETVFRTKGGERYHIKPHGNGNFYETTLESAKGAGLTPCKNKICYGH